MNFKLKTRKSALKRVKLKGKNCYRKSAYKSHLLRSKSNKRLRFLSQIKSINKTDKKAFYKMLVYL